METEVQQVPDEEALAVIGMVTTETPPMTNHIESWSAKLASGTVITSSMVRSFDHIAEPVADVTIRVKGVEYHCSCAPELGQRLKWFTRRAHKTGPEGTNGQPLNMPIVEIITEGSDAPRPRLYIHPVHGPMFSTFDLLL